MLDQIKEQVAQEMYQVPFKIMCTKITQKQLIEMMEIVAQRYADSLSKAPHRLLQFIDDNSFSSNDEFFIQTSEVKAQIHDYWFDVPKPYCEGKIINLNPVK